MSTKGQYYRHDSSIPSEKTCSECKLIFKKKPKEMWSEFKKKSFCSYRCHGDFLKHSRSKAQIKNLEKMLKLNRLNGGGHFGHKHSVESRKKMSAKAQGITTKEWKGFIKQTESQKIRRSIEFKLWRRSVLERDNKTCQECGAKDNIMHADHIKPFILFPELRFAIDNGRTLCVPCHKKTPTWGGKMRNYRLTNTGF